MAFLKFISSAFSQRTKGEKLLLRTVRNLKPRSIVELGIGDGQRTVEILESASKHQETLSYCGIDLFEATPGDQPRITLREAHKRFSTMASKVRLLPGDPETALQRSANDLTETDLLVISSQLQRLETVWTFAPRMLTEDSLVMLQTDNDEGWRVLMPSDLPSASGKSGKKRSAA